MHYVAVCCSSLGACEGSGLCTVLQCAIVWRPGQEGATCARPQIASAFASPAAGSQPALLLLTCTPRCAPSSTLIPADAMPCSSYLPTLSPCACSCFACALQADGEEEGGQEEDARSRRSAATARTKHSAWAHSRIFSDEEGSEGRGRQQAGRAALSTRSAPVQRGKGVRRGRRVHWA